MELDYVTALKYPTDNNGSQVIPVPGTYDLVLLQSLNSGYKFLSAPIKVRLNGRNTGNRGCSDDELRAYNRKDFHQWS